MKEHTPTPWTVGHGPGNKVEVWGMSLGVMEHDPREANAAFIVKAANSHDALVAVEKAARSYFMYAAQDEANERECCVDDEQHRRAIALKDALASIKDRP